MSEAVANLNGTMWIFAVLLAGSAILQAVLFTRHAWMFNKKTNLVPDHNIKSAVKVGAVAVIGPCLSTVLVAIATIAIMGPATTFMRCAVIGADSYELVLIDMGAQALGVEAGGPDFDETAFTVALFAMTFGTMPYLINLFLTLKPLDKALTAGMLSGTKAKKGAKKTFLSLFALSAAVGLITYNSASQCMSGAAYAGAWIVSVLVTWGFLSVSKKTGKSGLGDWALVFALIAGMASGTIIQAMG